MIDLAEIQKRILENKQRRGFNTTDIGKEIILLTEELGEVAAAYRDLCSVPQDNTPQAVEALAHVIKELSDMMVYILGMLAILEVDAEAILQQTVACN